MAQWLKHLPYKANDLNLVPRTHIKVEKKIDYTKLFSDLHTCAVTCSHATYITK